MTPLGSTIRKLRNQHGITLRQMATAIGVSASYLSALENGRKGLPSEKLINSICTYFSNYGINTQYLLQTASFSKTKFNVPRGSHPTVYLLAYFFEKYGQRLSIKEIEGIQKILKNSSIGKEEYI